MTGTIPFDQIKAVSLAQADRLLASWFPHGKRIGKEFRIGNIHGDVGKSLAINLTSGRWKDFAGDVSGHDLIDLRAAMAHGGDRNAAARELGHQLGVIPNGHDGALAIRSNKSDQTTEEWRPMIPPPPDAGRPPASMRSDFHIIHEYTGLDGRTTHYVGRIEARGNGPKIFIPIVFGILNGMRGWHKKHPVAPKPLYGLNRLSAFPDAMVILCEGEKSADAAQQMFPDRACLSWFGGAKAADLADLAPLRNRDVLIWPDADAPGAEAAATIARKLPECKILRVDDLPEGHDAADISPDDPETWLRKRMPPDLATHLANFLSIHAWADRQLPDPDRLLGDLLTTTSRMFLVGRTGLGKTLVGFGMAVGIANGEGFLHWRASRAARVLYIDGEMPGELIKMRSVDALRRTDLPPKPANLIIYSRDGEDEFAARFPSLGRMLPLNTETGQNFIMAIIAALGGVDAVVFDNVMSLIDGDQKDEIPWSDTLPLVSRLTAKRIGQIWLDHTGHNTDRQYGSATKAWRFDAVGLMTPLPDDKREAHEVAFSLSFDHPGKARRRTPNNEADFETRIVRLRDDRWTAEIVGDAPKRSAVPSPQAQAFFGALIAAAARSPTPGQISREEWFSEGVRQGLVTAVLPDDTHTRREAKRALFRKNISILKVAGWIDVDGETIRVRRRAN